MVPGPTRRDASFGIWIVRDVASTLGRGYLEARSTSMGSFPGAAGSAVLFVAGGWMGGESGVVQIHNAGANWL